MDSMTVTKKIEDRILMMRGHRVMLDADLAGLYGVTTKRLNEQVKRNISRFPADFMFILTREEKAEVVANCDHLKKLKYSNVLPAAFTEHGTIMLANVLKSERAVQASIQVVRTFIYLRRVMTAHTDISLRLDDLERRYDGQFRVVFDAIRKLMEPLPLKSKRRIGFDCLRGDK